MKLKYYLPLFLLVVGVFLFIGQAQAQAPPNRIFYQGRLTNDTGVPLNGTYDIQFSLFDSASGGSRVWGPEVHSSVEVERGVFSVFLGESTSLADLNFGQQYWLQMSVGEGGDWNTFSPRAEMSAVPYAFNAYHVEGLELEEVDWEHLAIETTDVHKDDVGLTEVQNINQADMDGNQLSWDQDAEEFNVEEGDGSGLDADMLEGRHAGNQPDSIPINNGELNQNLNAEMIEGKTWSEIDWEHLAIETTDVHKDDVGLTEVQNINQADMDGNQLSWDQDEEVYNVEEGDGSGLNADMLEGRHAGNEPGDIPINNGELNVNLNADMLDGEEGTHYKQDLADVLSVGNNFDGENMDVEDDKIFFYDGSSGSNIELTTSPSSGNDYGMALRPTSDPPGSAPVFRVLSAPGTEKFRVELEGRTETSNLFHASGDIETGGHLNMNGGDINQGGTLDMNSHTNGRLVLPVGDNKYAQ